jgi:predicted secreted hydrolase
MRRPLGALCLLTLAGLSSLCAEEGWRTSEPGWKYEFPRDHGPHREFKTEWWYATGTLSDGNGRDFGFQLTFFRQGIHPGGRPPGSSRFRVTELPFAHFAVTDVAGGTFRHFQKSSRGAFGEAGFSIPSPGESRMAWMEGWELRQEAPERFRLKACEAGRAIDLELLQQREPLLHGKDGISPKSAKPGHASNYYSLTRLHASGTVTIDGKVHAVTGLVWFDHEWSTNSLDPDEAGWDWSGLHLSNGEDLMIFRIRDRSGKTVFSSGSLRDGTGAVTDLTDLLLTPEGIWKSPHSGGLYPATLSVEIPSRNLHLTIKPRLPDQELLLSPFAYWEGSVRGEGRSGTNRVTAEGYLELTGYGGGIIGVNGR